MLRQSIFLPIAIASWYSAEMTGSNLNRLFPILLALAGCNIALSEIPVLGEAQRSSVQLKDGYWAVAERDCSFDPAKPVENWPRCADWVVLDHNQIVRQRDNNVLGLAPTMLIADGKPMILQLFSKWKDGETPLYTFAALEPTTTTPAGQIAAMGLWIIECEAQPSRTPPGSGAPSHYPGFDADCRPGSLDALRNAAAASRPPPDEIISAKWVRSAAN